MCITFTRSARVPTRVSRVVCVRRIDLLNQTHIPFHTCQGWIGRPRPLQWPVCCRSDAPAPVERSRRIRVFQVSSAPGAAPTRAWRALAARLPPQDPRAPPCKQRGDHSVAHVAVRGAAMRGLAARARGVAHEPRGGWRTGCSRGGRAVASGPPAAGIGGSGPRHRALAAPCPGDGVGTHGGLSLVDTDSVVLSTTPSY